MPAHLFYEWTILLLRQAHLQAIMLYVAAFGTFSLGAAMILLSYVLVHVF